MAESSLTELVVNYYDLCWGPRLASGHNPLSHAIHYGIYTSDADAPEEAKLNTNRCIARLAGIDGELEALRILDAGCGVGGTAIDVASRHPKVEIVGLTLSAQQVELASGFARQAVVSERVTFAQCDYTDTGLAPGSFDIIWAIESLCHVADRRAFFREASRLLRPGGRLIVADFFRTGASLEGPAQSLYKLACGGFAICDYYDEDLAVVGGALGFRMVEMQNLTDAVFPGVKRSAAKARAELDDVAKARTALERAHLLACTSMAELCQSGSLHYRIYRFEPG